MSRFNSSDRICHYGGAFLLVALAASLLMPVPTKAQMPAACEAILKHFEAMQEATGKESGPDGVPPSTMAISLLNEIDMGDQYSQVIESQYSLLESEQVQRVANRLMPFADRPILSYRVSVLGKTEQLNAFSIAGGRIYITQALLEAMEPTDGELAFIIGHEIAHAALRHIPSFIEASYGDYWGRLTICMAVRDGKVDEDVVIPAFQTLELSASFMNTEREFEADQFGALYAVQAGYSIADGFSALKKIRKLAGDVSGFGTSAESISDFVGGSILSLPTHPPISQRLEQLDLFSEQLQTVAESVDEGVRKLNNLDYDSAAETFESALKFFPQSRSLQMNLALAHHLQYRSTISQGDIPSGLLSTPEKLEVKFRRLVTRGGNANPPDTVVLNQAVAGYRQILAQDAEHYLARNNLAVAYLDQDEAELAISELDKAILVPAEYVVAYRNLTLACLSRLLSLGGEAAATPEGVALIQKADRNWSIYRDQRGGVATAEEVSVGRMVDSWKKRL